MILGHPILSLGKYFGAGISARLSKCNPNVVKYLGITLLPQAGVALGMAIKAIELGPEGAIVRNITLFAVLVYEIIGHSLLRLLLQRQEISMKKACKVPANFILPVRKYKII